MDLALEALRQRREQVDAELVGLGVAADRGDLRPHLLVADWAMAPMQPKPPASDTAATRRWYHTPPMPASITGCSTCRASVRRVRSMPGMLVAP